MKIKIFGGVSNVELMLFTKHLYIMLKSGVPIYEALESLRDNTKSRSFKNILTKVLVDIENGKMFDSALGYHPEAFDEFYVSLIKVSEESGSLEDTLRYLSVQLEKDYKLKQKIKGAMLYPGIVMTAGFGIGSFISIYVLPQLVDFFSSLEMELPLSTRILLAFATLMKNHGIVIIVSMIVGFFLIRTLLNSKFLIRYWHRILLKVPIFGKIIQYGQITRFCRNFSTLLKSGVPAPQGLSATAKTLNNMVFKEHVMQIERQLEKGKNVSDTLMRQKYKEFPSTVVKMIQVGEETGNLQEVLEYLCEFYDEEIDNLTKNLSTVLEPIMLVVMGVMVGFMAISIIGPIYQITGSIK